MKSIPTKGLNLRILCALNCNFNSPVSLLTLGLFSLEKGVKMCPFFEEELRDDEERGLAESNFSASLSFSHE